MAVENIQARRAEMTPIDFLSRGTRIIDSALCAVFIAIAFFTGSWFWWASAAFSAFAAITNPADKLVKLVVRRIFFKRVL